MKEFPEDEGYDDQFPLEFPFWYGEQLKASADGCLRYFVPTSQSEQLLDDYMTDLIQSFFNPSLQINADSISPKSSSPKIPLHFATPFDMDAYLKRLKRDFIDRATRTANPGMIGHMTSSLPFFQRPLAKLIAAMNQNVVKTETSSTFTNLERETIGMLHRTFYNNSSLFYETYGQSSRDCLGVLCSGGTIANISALWMARNTCLSEKRVSKIGVYSAMNELGYSRAVIIGSEMLHYSFKKAADILGIGEDGICCIPTDESFSIRADLLVQKIQQLKAENTLIISVIGIAGTTET
jgi:glutamate/tyrosine decarboxylase-like PLP-dependent enzyme